MAEIIVQMAKYCLPQIKYLLIHVFLIDFRQGNVKLVLLKEFKSIILHLSRTQVEFSKLLIIVIVPTSGLNSIFILLQSPPTVFLCLLNALVHRTHPLSSPKNLGKILVPIYRTQGDSVKHSRQKSSFKRQNTAYHRSRIC